MKVNADSWATQLQPLIFNKQKPSVDTIPSVPRDPASLSDATERESNDAKTPPAHLRGMPYGARRSRLYLVYGVLA